MVSRGYETSLADRSVWRVALIWSAVLAAAAFLMLQTATFIVQNGLVAARPPLSAAQTGLRLVLVAGALALLFARRDTLERVTFLVGAAAAGSSALFGFGWRSAPLSAFRVLSHLALYMLAAVVAWRALSTARRGLAG